MDEVRARLIEELKLRTEERVNHWNQLGDWRRQRPGRYISIDWRPNVRGSSSSAVSESIAEVTGIRVEDSIESSSSTTNTTSNTRQARSSVVTKKLDFESSAELGDRALNEFWDLWDVQKELQDLIELESSKEKSVEQPD